MLKTTDNSKRSEKRLSQYEALMRKFSEAHQKEECKRSWDIPTVKRATKHFPTGSQYEGTWDLLGMSGTGVYTFPNGVIYEGEFDNGTFHGHGEFQYPGGEVLKGRFRHGRVMDRTLIFSDGLHYCDVDWGYCRHEDRRFTIELDEGIRPADKTHMTADQPTRVIPPGHYDTGDGFYNPETKVVYRDDDITTILRTPTEREQQWIEDNCRISEQTEVGPRSDLYQEWLEPESELGIPPRPSAVTRKNECWFGSSKSSMSMFDDDDFAENSFEQYCGLRSDSSSLLTKYYTYE